MRSAPTAFLLGALAAACVVVHGCKPRPGPAQGPGHEGEAGAGLSPAARELVIEFEVGGGRRYYDARLRRPSWPGGSSGVTVGIGYDLGYNSRGRIGGDWAEHIPASSVGHMLAAAGVRGAPARSAAASLARWVTVEWEPANAVFDGATVPRFADETRRAFPGAERLPPDCFGALVSLVYNRGPDTDPAKPRRAEMAWIRRDIAAGAPDKVPAHIRAMKRLWAGTGMDGLLRRREKEAVLFERGLRQRTIDHDHADHRPGQRRQPGGDQDDVPRTYCLLHEGVAVPGRMERIRRFPRTAG